MANSLTVKTRPKVKFSSLPVGQALLYNNKLYLIKEYNPPVENIRGGNVVNMITGVHGYFAEDVPVEPVDLEIIVK